MAQTSEPSDRRHRLALLIAVLGAPLAVILAFWLLFSFVRPAPPRVVTMATGAAGGAYTVFAERYRDALAREGIELRLRPSSGSVENLRLLKTDPGIDLAFIQSGIAHEPESEDLALLGSMYVEPVWIFHRGAESLDRLTQLTDMKVAIGSPGSGTQLLALQLLAENEIPLDREGLLALDGNHAAAALLDGTVDAAFLVAAPEAPAVRKIIAAPGIRLVDLVHADAYVRRLPHLTKLNLPAGTLRLSPQDPAADVRLLGATANLVARSDLHPAIVSLILQAANEIHGSPGLFQQAGQYPVLHTRDLPPHPAARRFFESGAPFLQRYLPFWLAVVVDRLLVSLLPVIAILLPLMRITPLVYAWRMRSRIYRWYGELKFLERDLRMGVDRDRTAEYLARLDRIEDQANRKRIPLSFAGELYTLREHIQLVRGKILQGAAARGSDRAE